MVFQHTCMILKDQIWSKWHTCHLKHIWYPWENTQNSLSVISESCDKADPIEAENSDSYYNREGDVEGKGILSIKRGLHR